MPFLQTPEFQSGILPFLTALVGTFLFALVVRTSGNRPSAAGWTAIILPTGFLLTYWVLEGIAGFPPVASKQKVFYLAALATAAGLVLHLAGARTRAVTAAGLVWSLVALVWLTERQIGSAGLSLIVTLVILAAASVVVFAALGAADRAPATGTAEATDGATHHPGALQPGGGLMVAAFAAGIVSLQGAFIGMAQLSVAVGALLGGYLLVAWILYLAAGRAMRFGPFGIIGLGGAWLACVYVMVLFAGQMNLWALALILLTFLLIPVAARLRSRRDGALGRALQPVFFGAIVAVPAIAAAIWVLATGAESSGY